MKIQNIIDFYINIKNNEQLYCIEFSWEKNISNKYLKNLSVEPEERKEIIDLIIQRKIKLLNKFKYIFDEDTNDVEELKKIVEIKEKIMNKYKDEFSFNSLSQVYKKLIEIFSIKNKSDFQLYMKKLQELILNYSSKNQI
jgi:hypothetical protein